MTADTAEASIIVSTKTMTVDCGCSGTPFDFDVLTDAYRDVFLFVLNDGESRRVGNTYQYFSAIRAFGVAFTNSNSNPFRFQLTPAVGLNPTYAPARFLRLFPAGAQWVDGASTGTTSIWGGAPGFAIAHKRFDVSTNSYSTVGTGSTFPTSYDPLNRYALFSFGDSECAGGFCYGWIHLGLDLGPDGPIVTVRSWAYDDTGTMIAAGEGDPVPEPSTMALTGIAALALGAKGIRRWRAARNQES